MWSGWRTGMGAYEIEHSKIDGALIPHLPSSICQQIFQSTNLTMMR